MTSDMRRDQAFLEWCIDQFDPAELESAVDSLSTYDAAFDHKSFKIKIMNAYSKPGIYTKLDVFDVERLAAHVLGHSKEKITQTPSALCAFLAAISISAIVREDLAFELDTFVQPLLDIAEAQPMLAAWLCTGYLEERCEGTTSASEHVQVLAFAIAAIESIRLADSLERLVPLFTSRHDELTWRNINIAQDWHVLRNSATKIMSRMELLHEAFLEGRKDQ